MNTTIMKKLGFSTMLALGLATAGCEPLQAVKLKSTGVLAISGGSEINFDVATQSLTEGVGTITVTVTANPVSDYSIDVPFATTGSATNPEDHNIPSSGKITIPAGKSKASATFNIVDDKRYEDDKFIVLTLADPIVHIAEAHLGARSVQTISLKDNDLPPSVSFSLAAQAVSESAGTVTATVQLSAMSGKDATIPFTVSGTAAAPSDHSLSAGSVTIPAGATTGTITFNVVDDGIYEGDETVILTLGTPANASLGATPVHTVTIHDSSPVPTIQWSATSQSVGEAVGKVTLTANLSAKSALNVNAPYTVGGTATSGVDHKLAPGSISIPAGSTSATLQFDVVDDTVLESDETVIVTLGAPTGANLGANSVHTVTILDNEVPLPPVVQWSVGFQTVQENVGVVTSTAVLDKVSAMAVTVPIVVAGTATRPADHDLANGTITIPAGSLMGSVSFTVVDDAIYEGDETITLSMGVPTNATLGAAAVQTVTIKDNETMPALSFSAASQSVSEAVGAVTVTAKIDKASSSPVTAKFTVAGTATNPADHNLSSGTITIPAGAFQANISFNVVDDTIYEGDETVSLTLSSPVGALLGATSAHVVTILDNETAPTVQFGVAAQTVMESTGTGSIQVLLDKPSAKAVSVPYTVSGTATPTADYTLPAGTLTIAAGQTSANITFPIVKDGVTEPDETVIVTMGAPTGATLGARSVHTFTITDTVPAPTVQWSLASQSVLESVGTVTVTAFLNAPGTAAVSVPYTVSGTAANPADHNLANGTVTIPAGSTSANVVFNVVDDTIYEGSETVILTLGTPTGGTLGATTVQTITITDNETAPIAQFAATSQTVLENVGTVTVAANISTASAKATTLPFTVSGTATSPADHNLASGSITIPAGATTAAVSFSVVDDAVFEGTETVVLTLGAPTGATLGANTIHTVSITDNETAPTLQWQLASQSVSESVGTVTVQAALSGALSVATSFPYTVTGTATNPADHNLASGTVTIPAGSTSANVTFQIVNDTLFEGDETVILTMGNPTPSTLNLGANTVHTVTIKDDETTPVVQFSLASQTVLENVGTASVVATLSAAAGVNVTVPYTIGGTATNPSDYSLAAGTLTFAPGTVSKTISIPIVNDAINEPDETIILTLGAPTGATLGSVTTHTLTIKDDDALPVVQWSLAAQSVAESAGTVMLTASLNVAAPSIITVPVSFATTSTATSPADYTVASTTISFAAGSTSVAYPITIVDDKLYEDAETIVATLGTPTGATVGATKTQTVTITDNDAAPIIQWTMAAQNVDENLGTASVTASLSAVSGKAVTVNFAPGGNANNTTAGRVKYNLSPGALSIPAGSTTTTLAVPLVNDNLAGPSDFTVVLSLSNPVGATLGVVSAETLTIIDNDVASVYGQEGYRKTVWPLTRARCISCHGASGSLPNHASDTLQIAHDAAVPLTTFADIPNSRMVLKSADGHCGSYCSVTGAATDTKPLMIAAIQAWAPYETGPAPSPTPTATSPSTSSATVAVGIKDTGQYLEFLTGSVGLLSTSYRFVAPYTDLRERMSGDGDPTSITPTMLLAYTVLAGQICTDFVTAEKAFAVASTSRQAYGPINFTTTTNIATTVLTPANLDVVTTNLVHLFLKREPTADELTAIKTMVSNAIAGTTPTTTDTTRLMTAACVDIASSLDGISN